jgi:hypothetical protein
MKALGKMAGAAGLQNPCDFLPYHFMARKADGQMAEAADVYAYMPEGFLLDGTEDGHGFQERWGRANAHSFAPPER